jgi:hypothetical protein
MWQSVVLCLVNDGSGDMKVTSTNLNSWHDFFNFTMHRRFPVSQDELPFHNIFELLFNVIVQNFKEFFVDFRVLAGQKATTKLKVDHF